MSVVLEIEHIAKDFGGVRALSDLSFTVNGGELLGIIGPNGSGKTTLFNIVSGIYPPTSGWCKYTGHDITGLSPHEIARLGIVRTFQLVRLFDNAPAIFNVLVGMHQHIKTNLFGCILQTAGTRKAELEAGERARQCMQLVGLDDVDYQLTSNLPFGTKRRLEIARVLASEASTLLLDEPTSGMAAHEVSTLLDLFRKLHAEGKTIIIVEHNMNVIMNLCERIIVLDMGAKIMEGTPDEVRNSTLVREIYLGKEE